MRKLLTVIIAALYIMPISSRADAGWTGYGYITELFVNEKGRLVLTMNVPENGTDCRNKSAFYHDLHSKGSDYMFQLLLTALKENRKVRVYQTSVCDMKDHTNIYSVGLLPN
ncbi:MAG: hypothetical protein OEZ39_16895 [Gammaproteobacteria bacterium]|nr:hypothetical protein [Gammaproteobacteria bacterium]MDH5653539.1 hypothetical protein [Gammaproteobacteria bacterium]